MRRRRSHALRRRYGRSVSREALLDQAMRDWRSGRAYVSSLKGKERFVLHPVYKSSINDSWQIGHGRAKTAPWSKAAIAEWGGEGKFASDGLHKAARAKYPEEAMSSFERMHRLDPVRHRLLQESGDASS
jgi:hypothetical protein